MRGSRHRIVIAPVVLVLLWHGAVAAAGADWRPNERDRVLALGPWPPHWAADASNPLSGNAEAIELGHWLFFDSRLSHNGYVSCGACHQADRALTDHRARAQAQGPVDRNTPALFNLRAMPVYGWTGVAPNLATASLRPLLDERELAATPQLVADRIGLNDRLVCQYRRVFGVAPSADDRHLMARLALALAAFTETIVSGRTPFDAYRDALARGDRRAQAAYPVAARRGLRLFVGRGGCTACHAGANFSDGRLHDPGDAASGGAGRVTAGRYRTPGLRNVALTAPYLHDGSVDSLASAAAHRAPSSLSSGDRADLAAFLRTLTEPDPHRWRWQGDDRVLCR